MPSKNTPPAAQALDFKALARQMKALSNEHRLKMYLKILEHERTALTANMQRTCLISNVAAFFNLGAPTISHHIKTLEQAGLIDVQKQGKFITATINQAALQYALNAFRVRLIDAE